MARLLAQLFLSGGRPLFLSLTALMCAVSAPRSISLVLESFSLLSSCASLSECWTKTLHSPLESHSGHELHSASALFQSVTILERPVALH